MSQLKILPPIIKDKVRKFFLQSFQMRLLQEEFQSLDEGVKVSLKEMVKFEICEKVIS